jgi:hypothetical protein
VDEQNIVRRLQRKQKIVTETNSQLTQSLSEQTIIHQLDFNSLFEFFENKKHKRERETTDPFVSIRIAKESVEEIVMSIDFSFYPSKESTWRRIKNIGHFR